MIKIRKLYVLFLIILPMTFSFNNWGDSAYVEEGKFLEFVASMKKNNILTDKEYEALVKRSSRVSFDFFDKIKGLAASRIEGKSKNNQGKKVLKTKNEPIVDEDTSKERLDAEYLGKTIDKVFY